MKKRFVLILVGLFVLAVSKWPGLEADSLLFWTALCLLVLQVSLFNWGYGWIWIIGKVICVISGIALVPLTLSLVWLGLLYLGVKRTDPSLVSQLSPPVIVQVCWWILGIICPLELLIRLNQIGSPPNA